MKPHDHTKHIYINIILLLDDVFFIIHVLKLIFQHEWKLNHDCEYSIISL